MYMPLDYEKSIFSCMETRADSKCPKNYHFDNRSPVLKSAVMHGDDGA